MPPTLPDDGTLLAEEEIAPFTLKLTYRELAQDRGYAVHVNGPVNGAEEEILRFDCFEGTPHYHMGFSYRQSPFIEIAAANSLVWMLETLEQSFETLIVEAGGDITEGRMTSGRLVPALNRIRASAEAHSTSG